VPSPAASAELSVAALLDGGPRPTDPAAALAWRAGRRRIDTLTVGGPFDPRHVLRLTPAALAAWRAERRAWLAVVMKEAI